MVGLVASQPVVVTCVYRSPPVLSLACSVYRSPPVLSLACRCVYQSPPVLSLACSVYRSPPVLSLACSVYRSPPVLSLACSCVYPSCCWPLSLAMYGCVCHRPRSESSQHHVGWLRPHRRRRVRATGHSDWLHAAGVDGRYG